MRPKLRSRLGFPVLLMGAALLGSMACGRKESQAAPRLIQPGLVAASPVAPPPVTTEGQPGLPVVRIQADGLVTTSTSGHQAVASGDPGLQYEWFIQGGTLDGDTHGSSVNWTAGAPGEVRLFCQGTNQAGKKSVALARVQSEALPSIDRFEAMPPVATAGHAARLSWSAKEVKTLTLDPGAQDVTGVSGPGFEVKPPETTRYTLTATNAAGDAVSKTLELRVVPPPTVTSFRAAGGISFGQVLDLVAEFKGGKAEVKRAGNSLASGETSPIQVRVPALKAGDAFTITVTNEAGDSVTRTLQFTPPASAPAYVKP